MPNVVKVALDAERFGAQGITVHPRPDGRHIRYSDVWDLKKVVTTEFNIEGYPTPDFIAMVCAVCPTQVTLVPDLPDALTSNSGWDTVANHEFLSTVITQFKKHNIRVSIFVDPDEAMIIGAKEVGCDRVELYTESYATIYQQGDKVAAIKPFVEAASSAEQCGLGLNAGHDLNKENLAYFAQNLPNLDEVSIGHALIADALYLGLENTIQIYLRSLES